MSAPALLQIALFLAVLILLVKPLGWYMARVFDGKPCGLNSVLGWFEPGKDADGKAVPEQTIAVSPAASQVAIKRLGTNGGGFFNANSSHPFENPTPAANLIEVLSLVAISAASEADCTACWRSPSSRCSSPD